MARIVSFVVLVAILLVIAGLFFQVMADFLLPMFLAVLLVVIFKPLHLWFLERCKGWNRLAAGLTTASIVLIFLVPLALILWQAALEGGRIYNTLVPEVAQTDHGPEDGQPSDGGGDSGGSAFQPAYVLLPVFLAVLLFIVHRPMHQWFLARCRGQRRPALGLTMASVVLICVVPLAAVLWRSGGDQPAAKPQATEQISLKQRAVTELVELADRFGVELAAEDLEVAITDRLQQLLTPLALSTTQYVGGFLIKLGVMLISLYYFLADGPGMVRTVMRLSPLDDKYEAQLIDQFQDLTRAVVLATLLSAFTQGILAGIGFYLADLPSVFLLTVLAMLFAMIPFVGSTLVWVPACLWLHYSGSTVTAVMLAVYCTTFVAMADNVVKPIVLHGRSNLHPLLALLSVLGGVQALGPIGIFVGPMVVAFLQTLLNMLQSELDSMGSRPDPQTA